MKEENTSATFLPLVSKEKKTFWDTWLETLDFSFEYTCSYFTERTARLKSFEADVKLQKEDCDYLFYKGFRRSDSFYYKPDCKSCHDCIAYRLEVNKLVLSKSQRRILKKNNDLRFTIRTPQASKEKEEIYLKYQYHQHYKKPIDKNDKKKFDEKENLETMYQQMYGNISNSIEMNIYLEDKLLGFAIMDVGSFSLSAVYSVYDVDYNKRSLGIFFILQSILWAREKKYKYYYLGFYIPNHFKMEYKNKFQPGEVLDYETQEWQRY